MRSGGYSDGQIQAIDAAYVEAYASLDTLEAKKLADWTLEVNQEAEVLQLLDRSKI